MTQARRGHLPSTNPAINRLEPNKRVFPARTSFPRESPKHLELSAIGAGARRSEPGTFGCTPVEPTVGQNPDAEIKTTIRAEWWIAMRPGSESPVAVLQEPADISRELCGSW